MALVGYLGGQRYVTPLNTGAFGGMGIHNALGHQIITEVQIARRGAFRGTAIRNAPGY